MRAHRNSLDNLLPFFIAGSLLLVSSASSTAGMTDFIAFFVGRTAHTYAYSLAWLAIIAMTQHAGVVIVARAI